MITVKWTVYGEGEKAKKFTRSPHKNNPALCLQWALNNLRKKAIDFTIEDSSLKTNKNIVHPDYRAELARQLRAGKRRIKEMYLLLSDRDPDDPVSKLHEELTLHIYGAEGIKNQIKMVQCLGFPPDDFITKDKKDHQNE